MYIEKYSSCGGNQYKVNNIYFDTLTEAECYLASNPVLNVNNACSILMGISGVISAHPAGSQFYVGKLISDCDVIALIDDPSGLISSGFVKRDSYKNGSVNYRRHDIDVVTLVDKDKYLKWCAAACYCKEHCITNKTDVINIFNTIVN